MLVKTGTPAARAGPITASSDESTVLSPPIQIASAPRPTSEATASRTAAEPSTFASSSSIPSSLQTVRATLVQASEFASDGFQATPTRRQSRGEPAGHPETPRPPAASSRGRPCRAGASSGRPRAMPTPAATGSLTIPKTCGRFASRLAPATAWRLGVDRVMISSSSPPMIARAIVFDVAASPSALYRWTWSRPAFLVPRLRQPRQHAPGPLLEGRLRDVLEERDRADPRGRPRTRPDDAPPPRGRSRSVSSNTADAARIKNAASHNRSRLLIIDESERERFLPGEGRGTGSVTTPARSRS